MRLEARHYGHEERHVIGVVGLIQFEVVTIDAMNTLKVALSRDKCADNEDIVARSKHVETEKASLKHARLYELCQDVRGGSTSWIFLELYDPCLEQLLHVEIPQLRVKSPPSLLKLR